MRRVPLYSSSGHGSAGRSGAARSPAESERAAAADAQTPEAPLRGWRRFHARNERPLLVFFGGGLALMAVFLYSAVRPVPPPLTQRDIDAAVLFTLEGLPPQPSEESIAFQIVRPSVVWVRGGGMDENGVGTDQGMGTGVVINEDGTILTNLHVVGGLERLTVVFADGTESPAELVSADPDQDLAVIRALNLPDDLMPATLRSTRDLRQGDRVAAVGFPFGIGPSLSAGVVSGLGREYRGPEGERILTNLIQFDAAVNPGNSGGPLITMDGHVVGIVTALLNPNNQRVFIGIGFAVPIETAAARAGMSPF